MASFKDTLLRLLREGQNGITTVRALEMEMARLKGVDYENGVKGTADDWLTKNREPREPSIALVARAFNVPRETFPPAVTRKAQQSASLRGLESRQKLILSSLQRLEARVEQTRTLVAEGLGLQARARELEAELQPAPEDPPATAEDGL